MARARARARARTRARARARASRRDRFSSPRQNFLATEFPVTPVIKAIMFRIPVPRTSFPTLRYSVG